MASVWKHPQSRYWVACFTDGTGKQRKKSTKLTDKKEAQRVAESLEEAYRRKLSETQIRKLFSDAYSEIHQDKLTSATIADFLNGWVKRKENEISVNTWQKYRTVSARFLTFLGTNAGNDLNFLAPKTFIAFRDEVAGRLSASSANGYLKVLRVAFNDAWKTGLMLDNPAAKTSGIKRGGQGTGMERRAFTLDELKRLLSASTDEWHGLILCGLYTGQRLGDIARLRWTAVDLEEREIRFVTVKTGRPVLLPVAKPLFEYLIRLSAPDEPSAPVFPGAFEIVERSGKTGQLSNQFYDIMVAAGLCEPRGHRKMEEREGVARRTSEISFHCLRHTATSLLKNAGVSEAVAMDIIGHESKAISLNYTHIDTDAKRRAIERLPDISTDEKPPRSPAR